MRITLTERAAEALAEMLVGDAVAEDLLEKRSRDAERAAIREGIDGMRAGRMRPFDEFDAEFRRERGILERA